MAVVRSVSNCVYTNLAYEEFLFQKRFRATQSPILFLWLGLEFKGYFVFIRF